MTAEQVGGGAEMVSNIDQRSDCTIFRELLYDAVSSGYELAAAAQAGLIEIDSALDDVLAKQAIFRDFCSIIGKSTIYAFLADATGKHVNVVADLLKVDRLDFQLGWLLSHFPGQQG